MACWIGDWLGRYPFEEGVLALCEAALLEFRALGIEVGAEELFGALSEAWVEAYGIWDSGRGVADVLAAWRQAAAGIGAEVAVSREGGVVRGIFETIDDAGRLIVRANDNSRIAITAGDVHFGVTATAGR